ncbi:Hypothetical protein ADU72_0867 [Pediococcus damnosus]|uniref:Uncharacterized protein n=1 Tax=Pediococcus damnosus TaxID=51663 RepID=A0AAC9FJB1_9LACO|nr:Hypothetical protein ADU69_1024 [Pediococcus damnosus]AMV63290.1 Hypothetical protein ADU70_1824 [Pediococcus damnosus]AMV64999.1 Hypothetical protein ADU71_1101 [Pediococcus damnosus]AMV66812.1 Hypothetical protein ADU72_0867 [Pediococcus damnosus]AMV69824.1 Hypothetical protein ADU73_1430 [Pediococcus damnosus]
MILNLAKNKFFTFFFLHSLLPTDSKQITQWVVLQFVNSL